MADLDYQAIVQAIKDKTGENQAELAARFGVSQPTVSRWLGGTPPELHHAVVIDRVVRDLRLDPRTKVLVAEGERIDLAKLTPHQRKVVEAALPNPQAEVWLMKGDELAGAGYRPGDLLIVDVTTRPQPQHFVMAETLKVPIFRMYFPPYLFCVSLTSSSPPIIVDNEKTTIRGIVFTRLSF
jgi:transcriptional regulator with XRE-family HTH domain